jgi:5'-methylthioadenosine phosphorylase
VAEARVGVIGGSGLYAMEGLANVREVRVETPFGDPSDAITIGEIEGSPVAFLPRHGRGHRLMPGELPVQANIYALKSLGVAWIVSVSAVGSLREKIRPLDLVIPDQLIDRTKSRVNSFFGNGIVVHASFADPFCPTLSDILHEAAREIDVTVHKGGTYVVMEGPLFSTRAESLLYRSWNADIIGMTALPEAKLAREAEIHYATLACVTDYDVWHESEEPVTVEMVVANLLKNDDHSRAIVRKVAARIPESAACGCDRALQNAIITAPEAIPPAAKERMKLLVGKYVS